MVVTYNFGSVYVSSEGSGETAHCAVSPEPLKIALKRWDIEEGSAFYRPVQENLVLVAYASSEGSG